MKKILIQFIFIFSAFYGAYSSSGARPRLEKPNRETNEQENSILNDKNDENSNHGSSTLANIFFPDSNVPEAIQSDERLFEEVAKIISANFTLDETCPDQDLYDECYSLCRIDYLQCRDNCDNSICENGCQLEFTECSSSCPCGANCPNGCAGCENEICSDECENAETENLDFINCREAALENQASCIRQCPADRNCFEECNAAFLEELDECPCVQEETATTTTMSTTTIATNEPSDVNILVLGFWDLSDSYVFSGDGLTKTSATIETAVDYYARYSAFALVQGQMYIFGGYTDSQKIAKLEECSFTEQSIRLVNEITYGSAAIEIENGNKALLCFDYDSWKNCEIFDGTSSTSTFSSQFSHWYGGLGYYNGQPTTVGGAWRDSYKKVETYSTSGWRSLADHPRNIHSHTLTGLKSGAMLMAGGYDGASYEFIKDIWLLKEDVWSLIGSLKEYCFTGSALKVGNYIYQVSGDKKEDSNGLYPVERINIVNDEIIETEVIGGHEFYSTNPVIFDASANFCV